MKRELTNNYNLQFERDFFKAMIYQIQKSLGNVSAISVDSVASTGVCVEYKDLFPFTVVTFVIYQNGKIEDLCINGWTFPCVYNNIGTYGKMDDNRGGYSGFKLSFDCIDPYGNVRKVEKKRLYGKSHTDVIEYFYTLLYCISCCKDFEQYEQLYSFIIDNDWFIEKGKRKDAVAVLNFIESFTPRLSEVENKEFTAGLKQKLNKTFKEAQEIIAKADCP